jgi:hypothetical protein
MRFPGPLVSTTLVSALMCLSVSAQTLPSTPANNQPQTASSAAPTSTTPATAGAKATTADTVAQQVKDVKAIKDALNADSDLDFSLVIGIGSLIVVSGSTDYSDQSNVIHSNNIGKATPQFLTGVAFRSHLPNFLPRYHGCTWNETDGLPANGSAQASTTPTADKDKTDPHPKDVKTAKTEGGACSYAEPWQKRPWNAFVSVKFSPGANQTVNGFVFGASYAVTKYLNALVGFSLTPVNEPAPGFRTTAAQFVAAQQLQGQYLNFSPSAMLKNSPNAFDGFPVTDPTGKLIYSGNPLTVHYHGGAVFGVSIPIYFSSVFK